MPQCLPIAQTFPMRDTPIRVDAVSVPKPRFPPPVKLLARPILAQEMDQNGRERNQDDSGNSNKLCDDKKIVEPSARLGADRVRKTDDNQNANGQQLMDNIGLLAGNARGRVDALDKDNAQNGQRRRHDGHDPCPRSKKPKDIAKDVLEVWLDSPCY